MEEAAVKLRRLRPEDRDTLLKWLTDPCVLAFYEGRDRPFTPQMVESHFYENTECSRCIAEYQERSVGYLQYYCLDKAGFEEYGLPETSEKVYGMDLFIGEPALWGRGLGRIIITQMLEMLTEKMGASAVVLDPHVDNLRAIRCYEACGFRKQKILPAHELHEGQRKDCWLMKYELAQA